ncbi:hypothetical protein [Roseovarius sp. SYSU LYC5161]|uniref:hypothetical protein n=1 Tax=Roseovarius halophilus (ex Wu et al. 2025) TaxID=3376060 RepID=UPI0039998674
MLRLNLSTAPHWLDLGHGVRLLVEPLTTAIMLAARSDPAILDATIEAEGDAAHSNDDLARIVAKAVARIVVLYRGTVLRQRVALVRPPS